MHKMHDHPVYNCLGYKQDSKLTNTNPKPNPNSPTLFDLY